jgi:hypothetical protein
VTFLGGGFLAPWLLFGDSRPVALCLFLFGPAVAAYAGLMIRQREVRR